MTEDRANWTDVGRAQRRWLLETCVWGTLYALVGVLGLCLGGTPDQPSPFQPAAGVALAGVLVRGWRVLPGFALGAVALHALWDQANDITTPWWVPAALALAALVQALVGAAGITRFVRQPLTLAEPRDIGRFFGFCAAAAVAGTVLAVAAYWYCGAIAGSDAGAHAAAWWFGQALGAMVAAPMVLAWVGHSHADWKPRRSVLALPMAVLAAATGLGFVHLLQLDAERAGNRFELEASGAAAQLAAQLLGPQHALEAVRGLFLSGQTVDRQAFFLATRAWLDRPGHLHAIGWSERLAYADIAAFESRAQAEGFAGLRVQSASGDGGVRAVRPDEPIVAIRFIEPYERNRLAPGTNSSANPAAGPVIASALRSGLAAATPAFPLRLPAGAGALDPQGVVVYRAVYRGDPEPGNEAAREAAAYGLVFATLRMSELLASVSSTLAPGYALCLVDLSAEPAAPRIAGAPACDTRGSALTYRRPLQFADRRWELRVGVTSAADAAAASGFAWPFALFGFSGTAALGAMLLTVTGRTRRVELAVAEAERAREAAVAANQAKSEFLSRMSHELRTPLNAVVGFAQLMESDQERALGQRHRRWIGLVRQAGWHLLEMINDILDLSRIETDRLDLRTEALCLQPLLEQTLAMVERSATQRHVTITLVQGGEDLSVLGDATRVKQIVTNLLSNAVKYNVEHGRVEILCRALAGRVEIEVKDTGLGMSAAQLEQLFQPFNRLGREHTDLQGTGIGLVISRRLAEMMGGRLQVSSEAGKGSSFVLTLPGAAGGQAVRSEFGALDGGPPEEAHRAVLYVEDNEVNAEVMRGILADRPAISLEVSTTGLGALATARSQLPDLILLDLHLPDIHGLEVLRRLKAEPACANIPVVVVSADAMEAQVDAALQGGAIDFLTKPLHVRRFLAVLDAVLAVSPQRKA